MEPIASTTEGGVTFGAPTGRSVPARLFEIGDYPDKGFSLSESEADAAIAAFRPSPVLINHRLSDGNKPDLHGIGTLETVSRRGKEMYGVITFSDWAQGMLKGAERKLSLGWDAAKKIVEVSLVLDPRVESAALLHAFHLGDDGEPAAGRQKPERSGAAMSIWALLKEKLGATDAQVAEAKAEFSNSPEVTELKTKVEALTAENTDLKSKVETLGTGTAAQFAKTEAARLAKSYVGKKIAPADEAFTAAALEGSLAGWTFGKDLPDATKALIAQLDARPDLQASTQSFGSTEDPNGRKPEDKPAERFDAVATFNK